MGCGSATGGQSVFDWYNLAMPDSPVLVITGASSGIGAATARRAVEFDYRVVLAARSEEKLAALAEELENSFCRTDPDIARHFARVTFLSDNRSDLPQVTVPSLVLQCSDDAIAPAQVGDYVHLHLANSHLVRMRAQGHCPNLSAPEETVAAIMSFVSP